MLDNGEAAAQRRSPHEIRPYEDDVPDSGDADYENSEYNAESERKKNVLGKHIVQARQKAGYSYSKVAEGLNALGVDVQYSAIAKWERGATQPSAYQLIALSKVLDLGVDLDPLTSKPELNDEGIAELRKYRAGLIKSGQFVDTPHVDPRYRVKMVTMLVSNMSVSAGTGEYLGFDRESYKPVSVPASTVPPKADFGIRVSGDSMEPVYHDGQIVWIQKCEKLESGEVGVFVYEEQGFLKELSLRKPEPNKKQDFTDSEGNTYPQAVLLSFNKKYSPIIIGPEERLITVGRVCQ